MAHFTIVEFVENKLATKVWCLSTWIPQSPPPPAPPAGRAAPTEGKYFVFINLSAMTTGVTGATDQETSNSPGVLLPHLPHLLLHHYHLKITQNMSPTQAPIECVF